MQERGSVLLSRTGWVGCLLGAAATGYFLLGLAGQVRSPFLNLSLAAIAILSAAFFLAEFFAIPRRTNWFGRSLWLLILVLIVEEILLGLLPPTSRDELTHHLAIPKLYAQAGRIIEVPIAPYAYYPMLLDMLYTPWVYWGYDFVSKLIHGLYAGLTGLLLFAYLERRMNAVYGLLGFFFYLSMPVIARLSHWGYIDLGITFYTTAAMLSLLRWRETRSDLRWLSLAALSLGFALATKPNGLVAALLIGVLFALMLVKPPRPRFVTIARSLLVFGGLTLLPFLPWLWKNWFQTGNPFFPLLGNWFAAASGAAGAGAGIGTAGIFAKRELFYGENFWQIAALPLRVFLSGRDDNPQFFDGVLTPFLIVFLPWAFKGKWREEKNYLAAFALLFLFYAMFLVDLRIRYILSIVPPLVILAVYGIFNIYLSIKRPAYLFAAIGLFSLWHGIYAWRYWQEETPLAYLSGAVGRDAYLARRLPEYTSFQYIAKTTPADAKIYLLFVGRRAYYCERNYFHDGGELPGFLLAAIRGAASADQIEQKLKSRGITHLMVREDLLTAFLTNNLTPVQAALWNRFAETRLRLSFRDRNYAVYQIHG
jgi:hypothetical protein